MAQRPQRKAGIQSNAQRESRERPEFYTDPLSIGNPTVAGRRFFAEMLGTALLTLVAAGAPVIEAAAHQSLGPSAGLVAPGLLVMALIYTLGDVSGAHFNPVMTLAFALRGDFPWRRVPGYWLAQFVGSLLAALFLRLLFGPAGHLGATLPAPATGIWPAVFMETALTMLLVTVILGTAHDTRLVGHNAALAVGGTIALAGLFASPVSGASMNPARSFGPAVLSGNPAALNAMWIYFVAPVAGAVLASGIAWMLHGPTTPTAIQAASGNSFADTGSSKMSTTSATTKRR